MSIQEYLENLGWKSSQWTVLKAEETKPYKDIAGWQNYMYDAAKDPIGRKLFGKDALICKIEWIEANKPAEVQAEPKKELNNIPAPPPMPPVTPEPELEMTDFLLNRINVLKNTKDFSQHEKDSLISPKGDVYSYQEIDDMPNNDWTEIIKVQKEVKVDPLEDKIEKLLELGLKKDDKEPFLIDQEGKKTTVNHLKSISDADFDKLLNHYSPESIEERKVEAAFSKEALEKQREKQREDTERVEKEYKEKLLKKKEAEDKTLQVEQPKGSEGESLSEEVKEQIKFRLQGLKAAGWSEVSGNIMKSLSGEKLSYSEILDISEADFNNYINSPQEKPVNEVEKEKPQPNKVEVVEDKTEVDVALSTGMSRDEIAFQIMLKMVSPTSKKGAETIAKFSYDLADEMLKLKK